MGSAARRAQTGQRCSPVPRGGGRAGQGARGGGCGTRRDGAAPEPLATRSHQSPEGEPGAPRGRGRGDPGPSGGRRWGAAGAQVPGLGAGETGRGSVEVRPPPPSPPVSMGSRSPELCELQRGISGTAGPPPGPCGAGERTGSAGGSGGRGAAPGGCSAPCRGNNAGIGDGATQGVDTGLTLPGSCLSAFSATARAQLEAHF